MIRQQRPAIPDKFPSDAHAWLAGYTIAVGRDPLLTIGDYWERVRRQKRFRIYAKQLSDAFHGKCIYCENKPTSAVPLQIDHFRPKSNPLYRTLVFDWKNWLVACPQCNSNKGNKFEFCGTEPCLVDPTIDEPRQHIVFKGPFIRSRTERGEKTVRALKLDRSDLDSARGRWLMLIQCALLAFRNIASADRLVVRELLIWVMQDDAPFSAMARCYLEEYAPKLAIPLQPHPRIDGTHKITQLGEILRRYPNVLSS